MRDATACCSSIDASSPRNNRSLIRNLSSPVNVRLHANKNSPRPSNRTPSNLHHHFVAPLTRHPHPTFRLGRQIKLHPTRFASHTVAPFIHDFSRNREHPFTTGSFNFSLPIPPATPLAKPVLKQMPSHYLATRRPFAIDLRRLFARSRRPC